MVVIQGVAARAWGRGAGHSGPRPSPAAAGVASGTSPSCRYADALSHALRQFRCAAGGSVPLWAAKCCFCDLCPGSLIQASGTPLGDQVMSLRLEGGSTKCGRQPGGAAGGGRALLSAAAAPAARAALHTGAGRTKGVASADTFLTNAFARPAKFRMLTSTICLNRIVATPTLIYTLARGACRRRCDATAGACSARSTRQSRRAASAARPLTRARCLPRLAAPPRP